MCSDVTVRLSGVGKSYYAADGPFESVGRAIGLVAGESSEATRALADVTLEVQPGQSLGIIGRNGSGKSTLLRLICGVTAPSAGSVHVRGRVAALLELGAGFDPGASGLENVFLGAQVLGLSRREVEARLPAIEAFAELGTHIAHPVRTYSSGMVVRLAFAIATQVDADILVIDEALAVGDIYFVQKCMRFLEEFRRRGTLIFCTHDLGALAALADRAICLSDGKVIAQGDPREVLKAYLALPIRSATSGPIESTPRASGAESGEPRHSDAWFHPSEFEIEAFRQTSASFGSGGAVITHASLRAIEEMTDRIPRGGDRVLLEIRGVLRVAPVNPIVGFDFKNRLGQILFVENTFLAYPAPHRHWAAGDQFVARFEFIMPNLPPGEYSVDVAVADGTQDDHVQLHWIHDALAVRSLFRHRHGSLLVVRMESVELRGVSDAGSQAIREEVA